MKDEMKSETKRDDILRTDGTGRNEIELRDDDTKTGRDGTGRKQTKKQHQDGAGREENRPRDSTKTGRDGTE